MDTLWLKSIREERSYVMCGGGPRSLVTLGLMKQAGALGNATLLHVADGRRSGRRRLEHVRRQADFFAIERVKELALPTLYDNGRSTEADGTPRAVLGWSQLLVTVASHAARTGVSRVVWPVACDGDALKTAQAMEVLTLVQHMSLAEGIGGLRIDTPMLSLHDKQVIELGVRLGVSWSAAWVCVQDGATGCGACIGCRRKWKAMELAGARDDVAARPGGRLMRAA